MSADTITAKSDSERSMLMRMYAFLGVFVLLIFSLCVSGDCYFSAFVYRVAEWSGPLFACVWMVVFARYLRRKSYVIASRHGPQQLAAMQIPFFILGMGCLLGWVFWIGFYALLSLLVFSTAHTPSAAISHLRVQRVAGRCGVNYSFYDPPALRTISDCGVPYRGARSGDKIIVTQKIGPLGVHLQRVTGS